MAELRSGTLRRWCLATAIVCALTTSLGVLNAGLAQNVPARHGSYGALTRASLKGLVAAAAKLRSETPAAAQQSLAGVRASVNTLTTMIVAFRERSNREYDRCIAHKTELENRVAALATDKYDLDNKINELKARLREIETRRTDAQNQGKTLNQSIAALKTTLDDRQRRLNELRAYWWVPGYGAYLGIRYFVDDDLGTYNRLRQDLNDSTIRLQRNQNDADAARLMQSRLEYEQQEMIKTQNGLMQLQGETEARLGRLKDGSVFLTEAEAFWGGLEALLKIDVSQSVEIAARLATARDLANKTSSVPRFDTLDPGAVTTLSESLVGFADAVDRGQSYLLSDRTDVCGGPPRPAQANNVSARCNIEQFTAYYRIVDPKTCSFSYLNPPGCPPPPRSIATDEAVIARQRSSGAWQHADGQNWIGRSRCTSPHTLYYGKLDGADACERTCMGDSACVVWTFNIGNQVWPDSLFECWGGTTALTPKKENWSGFNSGGVTPPNRRTSQ